MSNNRTRAARKQVSKEHLTKRREAKGSKPPEVDQERQRASVAQLTRVYSILGGKIDTFEKKATASVQQLYANNESLKGGLSSAEFNLRAHQKAINAVCLELERFRVVLKAILPPEQREALEESVVQMSEVYLPPAEEGGDPVVVQRPNWPYYHAQVEKDLQILAEVEAKRREDEQIENERLVAETRAAAETEVMAESAMDDASVKGELPEVVELGEGVKEEAQSGPPSDGFPEEAVIFGG
jgi:hypothetical protein